MRHAHLVYCIPFVLEYGIILGWLWLLARIVYYGLAVVLLLGPGTFLPCSLRMMIVKPCLLWR